MCGQRGALPRATVAPVRFPRTGVGGGSKADRRTADEGREHQWGPRTASAMLRRNMRASRPRVQIGRLRSPSDVQLGELPSLGSISLNRRASRSAMTTVKADNWAIGLALPPVTPCGRWVSAGDCCSVQCSRLSDRPQRSRSRVSNCFAGSGRDINLRGCGSTVKMRLPSAMRCLQHNKTDVAGRRHYLAPPFNLVVPETFGLAYSSFHDGSSGRVGADYGPEQRTTARRAAGRG